MFVRHRSRSLDPKQVHSKQSLAKVLQDIALHKDVSLEKSIPAEAALQQPKVSELKGNATMAHQLGAP